ncbi:hypothetical protein PAAG_00913 [Paracoccidioides lutzii Pb01]|uniref:Protein kinase domain-containing protein n=1 Tax=Paracoccidioides lutzii (strain ATCC MYA-826 / Pb01) TaxID=502779 RepID=C1GQW8_PARBA|nr:hypothetical protein PAAG_00913 [Paracoccidioides lutzii Pb01]EEH37992.2 hypothetical protein PAAG_00913 [Paracoccidioides lutzii Pb01]
MAVGEAIEEQSLSRCHERHYYPAKIGDAFKDHQLLVIAKLGYGADLLTRINTTSRQMGFRRLADDIFEIDRASLMADTTASSQNPMARVFVETRWRNLLHLPTTILGADMSPQNVLMQLEDDNSLKDIEDQEPRDPSVPIITTDGAAPMYRSRETKLGFSGLPVTLLIKISPTVEDSDIQYILGQCQRKRILTINQINGSALLPVAFARNQEGLESLPSFLGYMKEAYPSLHIGTRQGVRTPHPQNLFRGLRLHNPRRGKRPVSQVHTEDTNLGSGSEAQLYKLIQDEWMMKPASEEDMVCLRNQIGVCNMDDCG